MNLLLGISNLRWDTEVMVPLSWEAREGRGIYLPRHPECMSHPQAKAGQWP